jgi:uncharacterized protein (UPF0332 family)
MIKPFEYYLKQNLARRTVPNPGMAGSLIIKAELRIKRAQTSKITAEESSLVFEDIYEALRESSQALMEIKSYKPYSHEALISFLKEEQLISDEEINVIDNYRILRNNSVYSAEKVSVTKCNEALAFARTILPKIKKKFEDLTI